MVSGPTAGSQPEVVTSVFDVDVPMADRVGGSQAVRGRDVKGRHPAAADAGQVAGVAAVVAADYHHQVQRVLVEQMYHRILPVLGGAADGIEGPETLRQLGVAKARPHRVAEHLADRQGLRAEHGRLVRTPDALQMPVWIEAGETASRNLARNSSGSPPPVI